LSALNRLVRRLKRGAYFSEPRFAVKRFLKFLLLTEARNKTQKRFSARRQLSLFFLKKPEENQQLISTSSTRCGVP